MDTIKLQIHNITEDEHFETSEFPLSGTVLDVKKDIYNLKGYDVSRQVHSLQNGVCTAQIFCVCVFRT